MFTLHYITFECRAVSHVTVLRTSYKDNTRIGTNRATTFGQKAGFSLSYDAINYSKPSSSFPKYKTITIPALRLATRAQKSTKGWLLRNNWSSPTFTITIYNTKDTKLRTEWN